MYMRIPPLTIKIVLESNPLKSRIFVGRLGVVIMVVMNDNEHNSHDNDHDDNNNDDNNNDDIF